MVSVVVVASSPDLSSMMRSGAVFVLLGQVFLLVERSHCKFFEHFKYKILANDGSRNQCKLKYLDFPCKYREKSETRPTK